jgi:hypothetical protein
LNDTCAILHRLTAKNSEIHFSALPAGIFSYNFFIASTLLQEFGEDLELG